MHTYRGLKLVHPPQLFHGRALSSPLEKVTADPQSGAFVHPGEALALEEVRSAQMARKALHAQARAAFHQRRTHPKSPSIDPVRRSPEEETKSTVKLENTALPEHLEVPPAHQFGKVEAACLFCGQITTDWWYIDRKSGRCKCRECLDKGIA